MEEIAKDAYILDEFVRMNEEILLLRNELAESWWSHNGWKFKDRNKFNFFAYAKETFLSMPNICRNQRPSNEILTEYFLGIRKEKSGKSSES
jgi:hypothetical protein